MIETMTVEETTERLRSLGVKISPSTLQAGLEQGVYPFGLAIRGRKSPIYQIYKRLFDEWVKERVTESAENG